MGKPKKHITNQTPYKVLKKALENTTDKAEIKEINHVLRILRNVGTGKWIIIKQY